MSLLCPRSQWLCQHCVCIVNGYVSTVAALSTAMSAPCLHCQRLCQHRVCIVNGYVSSMSALSTAMSAPCLHCQQLCQHHVCIVKGYVSTVSANSTSKLIPCPCSQWLHGHPFIANVFAKTKFLQNRFSLFILLKVQVDFLAKKGSKSRDTVFLSVGCCQVKLLAIYTSILYRACIPRPKRHFSWQLLVSQLVTSLVIL